MSRRFAAGALALYGLAARQLGWRPPDFWTATPAELLAALAPPPAAAGGIDRDTLHRMLEQDHG